MPAKPGDQTYEFILREALGVAIVVAAMIGLSIILLLGVLDWDDCLSEILAWDTLACLAEIELPYFTTEITSPSSPFALSLAKHLQSIEADSNHEVNTIEKLMLLLNYVECFPDGYKKGTKILKACADARIEGFPTWVINGQVLSGEQELSNLAQASSFDVNESSLPT
ncbi:hypothetical protein FEM48_Zijuj12G0127800 [Ziziphus jujuba var. spinosa]|uniref:Thioredoxin-like fold domain-containing protein n=1 Tax=Ziziphus jujuba var. spinosa TaxID=714518 RepID=A0A978UDF0_ZIZJJ|nr:hypothetical protein FEM48_Zijuj12G0127800 [Ziziphus jujuba var. spinosa]